MSSTDSPRELDRELARTVALNYAHDLESQPWTFDVFTRLVDDCLDIIADTRGRTTFILATGGPHVELEIGGLTPQLSVFWGGSETRLPLDVQTDEVDELISELWMGTMLNAINGDL